ncbi:hypothetical protein B0H67DRAFT_567862 [Lasiosphaeris hirsuta]|uniref:Uncharacterized protein n=1 Tax=Lasiosphaeris hirsuta TaxID=260670 RepID=A0AA40AYM2_9PEZI|nr:hypothetical protein B0H67DRAFT_567862 [Lasiosphaeris hirsuta]
MGNRKKLSLRLAMCSVLVYTPGPWLGFQLLPVTVMSPVFDCRRFMFSKWWMPWIARIQRDWVPTSRPRLLVASQWRCYIRQSQRHAV